MSADMSECKNVENSVHIDSNQDVQNVQIFPTIIKPKVPVNLNTDNILFEDLIYVATTFLPIVMTLKTQNTFK